MFFLSYSEGNWRFLEYFIKGHILDLSEGDQMDKGAHYYCLWQTKNVGYGS
ncbi:hypothetical protein GCM10023228_30030 [Brevibacillus fulvus]